VTPLFISQGKQNERRAPPFIEFDKIDTSDPLWAMPK
jgi:hypothetical protein